MWTDVSMFLVQVVCVFISSPFLLWASLVCVASSLPLWAVVPCLPLCMTAQAWLLESWTRCSSVLSSVTLGCSPAPIS